MRKGPASVVRKRTLCCRLNRPHISRLLGNIKSSLSHLLARPPVHLIISYRVHHRLSLKGNQTLLMMRPLRDSSPKVFFCQSKTTSPYFGHQFRNSRFFSFLWPFSVQSVLLTKQYSSLWWNVFVFFKVLQVHLDVTHCKRQRVTFLPYFHQWLPLMKTYCFSVHAE